MQAYAKETRKQWETFAETSRTTAATNNEEDTKKKKRTRQSGRETINYLRKIAQNNLELKKENNIKQVQEKRLRVSSENQLELFGQAINDQREQMQKVVNNWQKYVTAAESAHCGTVAYRTTISTNLYGNVGEIK